MSLPHHVQMFEFLVSTYVQDLNSDIQTDETSLNTILTKLESMGYKLGQTIIERATFNTSPKNELEAIKYTCKIFWVMLFNKEMDRLSTNRQGTYVLTDVNFAFHTSLWSPEKNSSTDISGVLRSNKKNHAKQQHENNPSEYSLLYLALISGLIRGALCCLGHICLVTGEVEESGLVKFVVAVTSSQAGIASQQSMQSGQS